MSSLCLLFASTQAWGHRERNTQPQRGLCGCFPKSQTKPNPKRTQTKSSPTQSQAKPNQSQSQENPNRANQIQSKPKRNHTKSKPNQTQSNPNQTRSKCDTSARKPVIDQGDNVSVRFRPNRTRSKCSIYFRMVTTDHAVSSSGSDQTEHGANAANIFGSR